MSAFERGGAAHPRYGDLPPLRAYTNVVWNSSASELIDWYRARWEIELFFLILKEGCRVQRLQLRARYARKFSEAGTCV